MKSVDVISVKVQMDYANKKLRKNAKGKTKSNDTL